MDGYFYRYEIFSGGKYIGGLFTGGKYSVLPKLKKTVRKSPDEVAISDYHMVDILLEKLESMIKTPKISKSLSVRFYYTEKANRLAYTDIEKIKGVIKKYGYHLECKVVISPELADIIYQDENQIAVINERKS